MRVREDGENESERRQRDGRIEEELKMKDDQENMLTKLQLIKEVMKGEMINV